MADEPIVALTKSFNKQFGLIMAKIGFLVGFIAGYVVALFEESHKDH